MFIEVRFPRKDLGFSSFRGRVSVAGLQGKVLAVAVSEEAPLWSSFQGADPLVWFLGYIPV